MTAPAITRAARTDAGEHTPVRVPEADSNAPAPRTGPGAVRGAGGRGAEVTAPRTAELTRARAGLPDPCPVRDCKRERQPLKLMCGPHWHQVPAPLQRAVSAAWRDGQGAGSAAHRAACAAAVSFAERRAEASQGTAPRSAVVISRGKHEDCVRDPRGHAFPRAKGDDSQWCLSCEQATRMAAAGIKADDPELAAWAQWNAIVSACPQPTPTPAVAR
jgi:hypothetical protein